MPIEAVAEAEAENKGRNEGKARVRKRRIHSITPRLKIILLTVNDLDDGHSLLLYPAEEYQRRGPTLIERDMRSFLNLVNVV